MCRDQEHDVGQKSHILDIGLISDIVSGILLSDRLLP